MAGAERGHVLKKEVSHCSGKKSEMCSEKEEKRRLFQRTTIQPFRRSEREVRPTIIGGENTWSKGEEAVGILMHKVVVLSEESGWYFRKV